MNPAKVKRESVVDLLDLPNVGPATAGDLRLLGYVKPAQLKGQDAYAMYAKLCEMTSQQHDPCVIDVFLSVVRFVDGEPPKPWWDFTEERKARLSNAKSH